MSPEQVRSSTHVTPRSDVWALGVVLFELVTGEQPFDDETTSGILNAILTQPPRRLSAVFGDVPAGLYPVIARCLEKDPAARYASARELAEALAPFCTEASFDRDESERLLFAEPLRERMRERDGGSSLPPASRRSACEAIELLPTERPPTEDDLQSPTFTTIPVPALPKR
jgi:serine/threonine protein kinase